MNQREQQRAETRTKILEAALEVFASIGFNEASTHKIARDAEVTQGLLTYHFRNKNELWMAVTEHLFTRVRNEMDNHLDEFGRSSRERARAWVRDFVRFAARYPVLMRFMIENNQNADERLDWIVPRYIRPGYALFSRHFVHVDEETRPYAFRAFLGAASLIFTAVGECKRLHGLDPQAEACVEQHADYVISLFLP